MLLHSSRAMLRKFLDFQLSCIANHKYLSALRPFVSAADTFCYEPAIQLTQRPFIRDAVDVKRWMVLVILALMPVFFMAIWNTGVQAYVYTSGDLATMKDYVTASHSLSGYFRFTCDPTRFGTILSVGFWTFIPILLVSYTVGILCEGVVAALRGHEIAEGFLVTGMLFPLTLPPTTPLWMVALGVAFGVVVGKELFGGTGMNIFNPALTARAFLFFTFPGNLSGDVWTGRHTLDVQKSLQQINAAGGLTEVDGYSQATALQGLSTAVPEIKRIHVEAIATNHLGSDVDSFATLSQHFETWKALHGQELELGHLTAAQMQAFVTSPLREGGLGLLPSHYQAAYDFTETLFGFEKFSTANLFLGNVAGSMGETSTLACLLGAFILIFVGVGSWKTMAAFGLGAFVTASLFQLASHTGLDGGAWTCVKFALPAYRHLIMGGLAFGLVYMATDPVSSPSMNLAKWIYGGMIGGLTIVIRVINPAYPEGVMLAILFGNVCAPLIDHYAVRLYRQRPKRV